MRLYNDSELEFGKSNRDLEPHTYIDVCVYINIYIWLVVSNIFYFHPYLGRISNLTNIFSDGLKPYVIII